MLDALRVMHQSWVGRAVMALVMGVIVVSFAIWGIGDVFRGFSTHRLAKVGSGEVTIEAFRAAYQNELTRLQQRLKRGITNEEARRAGLDLQVLERLVTDASLDQKASGLGLTMSEEETQKLIKSEKALQGPSGQFDPERYKEVVRNAGFTERGFVQDQRNAYLRKQITDSVISGLEPPRLMLEALHRFRNEARSVDYFILPASSIPAAAAPSDEELKKFYASHESAFRAKEFRTLSLLAVTPAAVAKPAEVTTEQARKLYDEVKAQRYGTPEKRDVRQIIFKTQDEAKDAIARLKSGAITFDALVAERKVPVKDTELGMVEQRDFGESSVGAAVFASDKPGVVEPVATAFGVVVSEVRKITPGNFSRTFEQAEPELRKEISSHQSAPEIRRLHDAVEEARTAGKPLAEAAQSVGLAVTPVEVDEGSRDRAGKEIPGLPGGADLLKAAFASDVGVDNDVVTTRDGGYVWFEVGKVERARQQTFEEVKDAVVASLRGEASQKALAARGKELVDAVHAGKAIDDVAKEVGAEVKRATDVKRAARAEFSSDAIVAIFDQAPKGVGSLPVDGGLLVFFIKDSATPKFDPTSIEAKAIAEQLKPSVDNDVLEQYVGGLEKALAVDINQKALQNATGAAAAADEDK
jgi:peptidyl-prolyl cis-trans isomerase D